MIYGDLAYPEMVMKIQKMEADNRKLLQILESVGRNDDYWRYHFAGMAMQGLVAIFESEATTYQFADKSVIMADALLARLKQGGGNDER